MAALPDKWLKTRLGDLIDGFEAGRNLRAEGRPATGTEFGVLKISAVSWGRFQPEENKALLARDAPKPHELVKKGDLLISRANTTELVGAVARVCEEHPRLMLPDKVLRLKVREHVVDPAFLLQALRLPAVRNHFEANATGTSDSMRNLSQPKLEAAPVLLPPLNEQRRIVAKLEALQSRSRRARESLEAVPPLLKKLRQCVLAAAFRGDLTADWRALHPDTEPVSKVLQRIPTPPLPSRAKSRSIAVLPGDCGLSVGNPGTPTPTGWKWVSLIDVARLESGHTPSRLRPEWWGGEIPWIGIKDARDHHGRTIAETRQTTNAIGLANSAARLLPRGTVCLSRTATIGYVTVMGEEMATSQDFVNWVCTEAVETHWLKWLLIAERQALLRYSSQSTNVATIFYPELLAFHVCLPPPEEQREIVRQVERLMALAVKVEQAHTGGAQLLPLLAKSMLAKAFRGELVPQDPNDEPAEVPLTRHSRRSQATE